jgi:hypothetical protein
MIRCIAVYVVLGIYFCSCIVFLGFFNVVHCTLPCPASCLLAFVGYYEICPTVYVSACLSLCLSIHLSVSVSVYVSVYLPVCLSIHPSLCMCFCEGCWKSNAFCFFPLMVMAISLKQKLLNCTVQFFELYCVILHSYS